MGKLLQDIDRQIGVGRSMLIYYGVPGRLRQLRQFYGQFIRPGDLCFDIGAHVGNRIAAWTRLDAKVVAVEPQSHLVNWLRRFYGRNRDVTLVEAAVGAERGTAQLVSSRRNPTVGTLSRDWLARVSREKSFESVHWNTTSDVDVITLDDLIADYGLPFLCKIDTEGYEAQVLAGLSAALPVVSFEYIPAAIETAHACVVRLNDLGDYEFNWFVGETHRWSSAEWLSPTEMHDRLSQLATGRASGDVFARLISVAGGHG